MARQSLGFIWIQSRKLQICRTISGIRYPFPNELHSHGCRDAANERSRPSAIFENSNCTVPVIIITGKPSARSEAFYLESGAVGFFRKPVDGDALVELIGSVGV